MRVLLASNGNYRHPGRHYYDVWAKLRNGFIRGGHTVQFFSDRDTARMGSLFGSSRFGGVARCNRALVETAGNFRPDLLVLSHVDLITSNALAEIRALLPSIRIAQHNGDIVFGPRFEQRMLHWIDHIDATFLTTAGDVLKRFARPSKIACYVPNPVDASIETLWCHERDDQPHDVFFAMRGIHGSFPGDVRLGIPAYLAQQEGIVMDYHGIHGRAPLFGAAYYEHIARARMGLNLNVTKLSEHHQALPEELHLYSSDRLAQYLGCGLLVLSTREHGLQHWFAEDGEMVFYDTKEELADKVRHYKKNAAARMRIAQAGWRKAHAQFNERLVAKYIEEVTFGLPLTHDYAWPTQRY